MSRINQIPRIDTYFFKIHSNIDLSSMSRSPYWYLSCRFTYWNLKALLPSSILATWPAQLNFIELITLTTVYFLLLEKKRFHFMRGSISWEIDTTRNHYEFYLLALEGHSYASLVLEYVNLLVFCFNCKQTCFQHRARWQ